MKAQGRSEQHGIVSYMGKSENVGTLERGLSVAAGTALLFMAKDREPLAKLALFGLAGSFLFRGLTGYCKVNEMMGRNTAESYGMGGRTRVRKSITVNRDPNELYQFWRRLRNLPRILSHLESVEEISEKRSHWVVKAPLGNKVEWDAEIVEEQPGRFIRWQSVENADVDNEGIIRFEPAPDGNGTRITVSLRYDPPGGKIGAAVARLFMENPDRQVEDDLKKFKQAIESGAESTFTGREAGGAGAQLSH